MTTHVRPPDWMSSTAKNSRGCSTRSAKVSRQPARWGRLPFVADGPGPRVLSPTTMRFCPLSAAPLRRGSGRPDQREQAVCPGCEFVFYLNPKVVAGTIPEQDGRLLLTRRSINPGRRAGGFPGGGGALGGSARL